MGSGEAQVMKLKREAVALKERLEEKNPGSEYEVCRGTDYPRSPWYVKRTKRPRKEE